MSRPTASNSRRHPSVPGSLPEPTLDSGSATLSARVPAPLPLTTPPPRSLTSSDDDELPPRSDHVYAFPIGPPYRQPSDIPCPLCGHHIPRRDRDDASDVASTTSTDSDAAAEVEFLRSDARDLIRRQDVVDHAMDALLDDHDERGQQYHLLFIRAFQLIGTLQQEVRDLRARLVPTPAAASSA